MSNPAFKRLEVADVFTPERIATFERPREDSQIVKMTFGNVSFYCEAGTLRVLSDVLTDPPIANRKSPIVNPT